MEHLNLFLIGWAVVTAMTLMWTLAERPLPRKRRNAVRRH